MDFSFVNCMLLFLNLFIMIGILFKLICIVLVSFWCCFLQFVVVFKYILLFMLLKLRQYFFMQFVISKILLMMFLNLCFIYNLILLMILRVVCMVFLLSFMIIVGLFIDWLQRLNMFLSCCLEIKILVLVWFIMVVSVGNYVFIFLFGDFLILQYFNLM